MTGVRRTIQVMALLAVSLFSEAMAGYAVEQLYCAKGFSGVSVSGRAILILPLLTPNGFDTSSALSPEEMQRWLKKNRRDLHFSIDRGFETAYVDNHDSASLAGFYNNLFKGEMVPVQTSDSVWSAIKLPFVLAVRLKGGATIKDFEHTAHRVLLLEAELWDVKNAEPVWRVGLTGRSNNRREGDVEFVVKAVREIFKALPVAPYDENPDGDW